MINGAFLLLPAARDLSLQQGDARVELGDGERVEVLPRQLGGGIVRSTRKIVHFHCGAALTDDQPMSITAERKTGDRVTLPNTMRAIDPETPGGPEVLVEVRRPVPQPGPGEVLVKVAAAGVNRPDVIQRIGAYPPPPGVTSIPGLEIAGQVVAVGADVPPEMIGQPMCALIAGGGYAEYAVAPLGQCLPVPEALTLIEAAAMPETLFTVWTNLFERGYASEGDTVLVHGGTSGIGTMAIGLCNLFGIEIIVTAGSYEKIQAAALLGADHAIDYNAGDFVEEVKRITDGKGVAVVLDMVGGDYVPRNLKCLAEDGRHVSIAVQSGATATIPIFDVMRRRLTLTGSTLRARDVAFKTLVADELARAVWPLVEAGKLKPVIDRTFPLSQAADAHRRMEAGAHIGKIVLEVA